MTRQPTIAPQKYKVLKNIHLSFAWFNLKQYWEMKYTKGLKLKANWQADSKIYLKLYPNLLPIYLLKAAESEKLTSSKFN